MAFTPQDEEDLKKRILALEEEKIQQKKELEGRASKKELTEALAPITKELSEARAEWKERKEIKQAAAKNGPSADDEDSDGWPFDMMDRDGGEGD